MERLRNGYTLWASIQKGARRTKPTTGYCTMISPNRRANHVKAAKVLVKHFLPLDIAKEYIVDDLPDPLAKRKERESQREQTGNVGMAMQEPSNQEPAQSQKGGKGKGKNKGKGKGKSEGNSPKH